MRQDEWNKSSSKNKKEALLLLCECVSYNVTLILHFIILKASYCCSSSLAWIGGVVVSKCVN